MGASLSWLAVRGKTSRAVRAELGLRPAGRRERHPQSPVTGIKLTGGWYLLVENHRPKNQYVRDSVLETLSAGCEVITCAVEEHVMCSEAAGWIDGVKTWSVIHEAEKGAQDLRTNGEMPAAFDAIRRRLLFEQDGEADYVFEIPVELAESVTGYRHDADAPGADDNGFEVFISKKSGWEIIFNSIRFLLGILGPVLGVLLAPLIYLRSINLEIPQEVRDSGRHSVWRPVYILFCMASWVVISFGLFRLVWFFHMKMYPNHELHDFWGKDISIRSFIPSFLMVFAPVPGAMAIGLLVCSILVWLLVPPARRAFQSVSPEQPGMIFWRATGRLFKYTLVTFSVGMLIALVAASLLKSLR